MGAPGKDLNWAPENSGVSGVQTQRFRRVAGGGPRLRILLLKRFCLALKARFYVQDCAFRLLMLLLVLVAAKPMTVATSEWQRRKRLEIAAS
jgi:hypothetical protein